MDKIDSLDKQIITLLEINAKQSSRSLAKQLNVSSLTIRRRINNLIRENVINFRVLQNPIKLGFVVIAVFALDIDPASAETAAATLSNKDNVEWVSIVTGRFDIMAVIRFKSMEDLYLFQQEVLSKITGIKNCETFICTKVKKGLGIVG